MNAYRRAFAMRGQAVSLVVSRLISTVLQAVTVILLARQVDPALFGIVSTILGALVFVNAVADFGMAPLLSKVYAVGDFDAVNSIVRVNLVTTVTVGLLTSVLLAIGASFGLYPYGLTLLGVALALEKNVDTLLSIPFAAGRRYVPGLSMIIRRLVTVATFIGLIAGVGALSAYCIAMLAASLSGQLHALSFARTKKGPVAPARVILRMAWPFAINSLAAQSRSLDVVVVGALNGPMTAALYSAGARLASPLAILPGSLAALALPHSTRLDRRAALRATQRLGVLHLAILILLTPTWFVSEAVMSLLFGDEYAGAGMIFSILLYAVVVFGFSTVLGSILQGQGLERAVAIIGPLFAVISLAATALGSLWLGGIGGALGLTFAFLAKCIVMMFRLRRP